MPAICIMCIRGIIAEREKLILFFGFVGQDPCGPEYFICEFPPHPVPSSFLKNCPV